MHLAFMQDLAQQAGRIGMRYFGRVERQYKPDQSIVTEADLDIEEFLVAEIRRRYPDHSIVAEETAPAAIRPGPFVWAVDPVDGTQVFAAGMPFWAISIGFMEEGRPVKGVVFQPALGDLYSGEGDEVYCNGRRLPAPLAQPLDENSYLMVPEMVHQKYRLDWMGDCLSLGSVASHCCLVARGSAVGCLTRPFIWDLVAGVALMGGLGIATRYLDGSPIDWLALCDGRRLSQPCLAAAETHWSQLRAAVAGWEP